MAEGESPGASVVLNRTLEIARNLSKGQVELRAAYEKHPTTHPLLKGRAKLVDQAVRQIWKACGMPEDIALVAVGGYGRGELFPASDVDLLILLQDVESDALKAKLSELVSTLWDVGLDIGHSVRTVDECLTESERDVTIQTNLLEARFLIGDEALFEDFTLRFQDAMDPKAFFKAKRLEQEQRYTRYNDTPFSLEPNCKESPGGLRDIQLLGWISRAAGFGRNWRDLVSRKLLTPDEATDLRQIERFLQHVRIRLHYLTGRAEDRLLFDHQEKIARAMGFEPAPGKRASEVFMQRYYVEAKKLTQINTILLQNYGTEIFPARLAPAIVINDRFQCVRELLDIRHDQVFLETPSALFECFHLLQERSDLKGMTARTLRALWLNRKGVNAAFRADPQNQARFIQMLQAKRGIVHEFRRMNQYGILSRYLLPWRKIVGQMQHDLFHVYTVDQHILMVLRNLRRFTMGEHGHEYPLMTRLMLGFTEHWLLYAAALFHDIAKGRGGDHSKLGMHDADEFCRHHHLAAEQRELVVWLVENHLTMSHFAQREDTSDPEVVRRFAQIVGSERRLTALYLLTHADIRGTSPKVWNGWKGKLLEDLYFATQRLLRGATPQQALGLDDRQEDARGLLRYFGLRPGVEETLWSKLDAVYFMRHSAEEIAWHTRLLYYRSESEDPLVKVRVADNGEGLQVMVYAKDQKDLFMRVCSFFSKLDFTILDAKIHTTRHGYALDSFILQDPGHEGHYRESSALIEHELADRIRRQGPVDRPHQGRLSRQLKHFPITPHVRIQPDDAGRHYILSLTAADRPGLLFSVAEILAQHNISLQTAKIATLGDRVEDTFLLTGGGLSQDAQVLRVESELLERLQV